jgi:hypothetical protein
VVIHASAGVVGLFAGLGTLSPPRPGDNRSWLRALYLLCIVIMLAFLIALVVLDWDGLDMGSRIAFTALTGLGAVMGFRIIRARQVASAQQPGWQGRYIDHVYFTYISLWEGFVILPALSLPLPQVTVPLVAVGVLLIGHTLVTRYKAGVLARSP